MPKKKQKYQNLIYVQLESDLDNEPYIMGYYNTTDVAEVGSEIEVGIYQFVKTVKVRTKIEVI